MPSYIISQQEYADISRGARELERDSFGVKVLLRPDNRIIKLFRVKRMLSLSAIYPYSVRFWFNARRLQRLGVRTVTVERLFYCHAIRRHGIIYPLLQGDTLADLLQADPDRLDLLEQLAGYVAWLHSKGIYFRSLHLGNVLLLPDGELGLIDVADMRLHRHPLGAGQRRRNFAHLLRRQEHRAVFERFGLERFLDLYLQAAKLSELQELRVRQLL
jgi:tRNA A-37 threonylcarbamoyl transferase component Bud32